MNLGTFPNWIRWILFFPVAIIALAIIYPLVRLGNVLFSPVDHGVLFEIFVAVVGAGASGYAFVWCGAKIAPYKQFAVALLMTTLYCLVAVTILAAKIQLKNVITSSWLDIFSVVFIGSIGAILACYSMKASTQIRSGDKKATVIEDESYEEHGKTLSAKAEDAPIDFRILVDCIQIKLEREFPQVLLLQRWSTFQEIATVAGCVALSLRLHFDVQFDQRTPLEMKMREVLEKRFPQSEQAYENCSQFLKQGLAEIPRGERGNYTFLLLAMWVSGIISRNQQYEAEEQVIAELALVYQNETSGFWKDNVIRGS